MPDLQLLEPASFGPSTLPFSQGVKAGLANFGLYNEAWVEAFGDHRPARATVQAGLLLDMLVEVQAIAVVG